MNKQRKKSSQKQFMQTMIMSGVLGSVVLMVVMIYMIKLFGTKKATVVDNTMPTLSDNYHREIESEEIIGVVHEIAPKRKNIKVWDIKEKQFSKVYIKERAQMKDAYGKPMSVQEIQIGDIVEITYEPDKKEVLILQKSARAWKKSNISNIDINTSSKIINIGNKQYEYSNDIIVTNDNLEIVNISDINSLDTLEIKGIDDTIWSVQVIQAAGYLKLINIPTKKGNLEIGNNKIYRLDEIDDDIPLPGGKHKIVVRMEGYKPFATYLTISTNQIEELDLKDVEEEVVNLRVRVTNTEEDYKVHINDKTYKKDEAITIKPGVYTLKVSAGGFKTWAMDVRLEEGDRKINLALQPEKKEPEAQSQQNPVINSPNINNSNTNNSNTNTQESYIPEANPPVEEIKTVQIIIETDPADAKVFVGGVYKGTTPALTGLKPGEYSITIEKDGYSPLYSTIIIDAGNAQKGFLYTLQKE